METTREVCETRLSSAEPGRAEAPTPEDTTTSNGSHLEVLHSSRLDEALSKGRPGCAQGTPSGASSGGKKRKHQALMDAAAMHSCPAHDVCSTQGNSSINKRDPCSEGCGQGRNKRPRSRERFSVLSNGLLEERNPGEDGPCCSEAEKVYCGERRISGADHSSPGKHADCASPSKSAPRLGTSAWTVAGFSKILPSAFLSPRRSPKTEMNQGTEGPGMRLGPGNDDGTLGSSIRDEPGCSTANEGVFCMTSVFCV